MKKQPRIIHVAPSGFCNPLMRIDCNGAKCDDGCPLAEETSPKKTIAWLREQFCDPGDSDLSKVKVGDWIYTLNGWERVDDILTHSDYPIRTAHESYTYTGKRQVANIHPSAWIRPPAYFNAPPRPQSEPEFKKGDRVLVRDNENEQWVKRYFSHYVLTDNLQYRCFIDGKDEWASNGRIMGWKYCKKWEEE